MRIFWRALLLFSLCAVFVGAGWAQNVETFSAGSGANSAGPGGEYDASVCDDPQIPILAAQQKATPYHDPNWNTPGDPLQEALQILAQEYNNNSIDRAGACAHAPGVVFMVPTNLIPQVTKLIGQIVSIQNGGQNGGQSGGGNNGSGGTPSQGQPITGGANGVGGTPGTTGNKGGPGNNGGPTNVRGGPPPNYAPMPGPAGGIGYQPGPNPCIANGGYDYCKNGPGARLPPGCYCDGTPPTPRLHGSVSKTVLPKPKPSNPDVDQLRYVAGFVNGVGSCIQSYVNLIAAAGWVARGLGRLAVKNEAAQVANTSHVSTASLFAGDDFANAAQLLGLQPGQSIALRQVVTEASVPKVGLLKDTDPYTAASSAGLRVCTFGIAQGVIKGLKGEPEPPAAGPPAPKTPQPPGVSPQRTPAGTPGAPPSGPPAGGPSGTPSASPEGTPTSLEGGTVAGGTVPAGGVPANVPPPSISLGGRSPSNPLSGTALVGAVSNKATAPGLDGAYVKTPTGPLQLGPFLGKGTFGSVFRLGQNPQKAIKIPTNTPGSEKSLTNQVTGSTRLKTIQVDTPNLESIAGEGGNPPMLLMDNAFAKPGAFQLKADGSIVTEATLEAGENAVLQKAGPTLLKQADEAVQKLYADIANGGYIAPDLSSGNIIFYPKPGGLIAGVVDSDMIMTKAEFVDSLGGKTGRQLLTDSKNISTPAANAVSVLNTGDMLDALENTNFTTQSMMQALFESRQLVMNAARAR